MLQLGQSNGLAPAHLLFGFLEKYRLLGRKYIIGIDQSPRFYKHAVRLLRERNKITLLQLERF